MRLHQCVTVLPRASGDHTACLGPAPVIAASTAPASITRMRGGRTSCVLRRHTSPVTASPEPSPFVRLGLFVRKLGPEPPAARLASYVQRLRGYGFDCSPILRKFVACGAALTEEMVRHSAWCLASGTSAMNTTANDCHTHSLQWRTVSPHSMSIRRTCPAVCTVALATMVQPNTIRHSHTTTEQYAGPVTKPPFHLDIVVGTL